MKELLNKEEKIVRRKIEEKGLEPNRELSIYINKYKEKHRNENIIIRGNIYIIEKEKWKKVWAGDLNLNIDGIKLKEIEKETGIRLYIINEKEGNSRKEKKEIEWNTGEEIPKLKEGNIKEENKNIKGEGEDIRKREEEENKRFKIEDVNMINGRKVIRGIKIPYEKIKKNENRRMIEGYISREIIEEEVKRLMDKRIEKEKYWITERTKENIIKIEKEIEMRKGERKNIEEVIKGWNIITIERANRERKNIRSYNEDYVYITE